MMAKKQGYIKYKSEKLQIFEEFRTLSLNTSENLRLNYTMQSMKLIQ